MNTWRTYLEDILGRHTWRTYLEDIPGGHTWRTCLEDIPRGHTWWTSLKNSLEDTPGGYTWRRPSRKPSRTPLGNKGLNGVLLKVSYRVPIL
jgi:hypothetical protein